MKYIFILCNLSLDWNYCYLFILLKESNRRNGVEEVIGVDSFGIIGFGATGERVGGIVVFGID